MVSNRLNGSGSNRGCLTGETNDVVRSYGFALTEQASVDTSYKTLHSNSAKCSARPVALNHSPQLAFFRRVRISAVSVTHSSVNNHDSPWNSVPVRPLFRFPSVRSLVKNHNTDPKELSLSSFDGTSHPCRESFLSYRTSFW
jgi:hypothetical protein